MAKQTLLQMTQQILAESDGDNVNSISDTVESDQCARVIKETHDYIVDTKDVQHTSSVKQLTATSGTTPNVMTRPEGFHTIEWVRYDKRTTSGANSNFETVNYMDPDTFLGMVLARDTDDTNVTAVTISAELVIPVINDRSPIYYSVFDTGSDDLIFDAYDSDLETNLQASKSMAYGTVKPSLTLSDSSTMDLPRHMEQFIVAEARAMYFDLYKDGVTSEVDRRRRRTEVRQQRQRNIIENTDNDNRPDYGRK